MTRTNWTPSKAPYPPARRSDASTTYASAKHGKVTVPEPYDWLETPPSQSEETAAWTKAQAAYTDAFLAECGDKEAFKKRLEQNWDYVRTSAPSHKRDGRYYYSYNAGLAPQSVIYRATREEIDAVHGTSQKEPVGELFFDTNVLSDDGTVALSLTAFSHTGKYVTYGLSVSGSDWIKLYVRPTDAPLVSNDGTEGGAGRLADVIENVKFSSAVWTHDDQGFFYQRYPAVSHEDKGTETDANQDAELYYHRLGTPQSDDVLVIARDAATPSSMWHPTVTDDGKWVLLENSKDTDTKQRFYLAPLEGQTIGASMRWIPISTEFKYTLGYLGNDGNRFYFITNKDAPNYRVVALDVDPAQAVATEHVAELTGANDAFVDLVAEDSKAIVTSAKIVDQNKLLVLVSRDVKDELWLHDLEGKQITRLLPDLVGTVGQVAGLREDREVFVLTVSFSNPGTVHRIAWQGEPSKVEGPTSVEVYSATHVAGIRPEEYTSTQIFVPSKDGTEIPVFLTYPKSMPLDGSAPALVYFYGGFNIPLNPVFSPSMMTWVASYGGILAFVNARGGGEYGDKWHEAGMLFNKQNVFDDVMAATQHLHEHKYAAKGKITIMGGSNGGLGVAAVANQCTDASGIGAAIADVGVHDMLKFPLWTIGKAWAADYGNPQEDGAAFDYNYAYSPLHNVTQKVYPTMILACADHDDRVVPAHSFKLAAELQHQRKDNPNPLLLRVELQAGHGAGKSTQKRIDEASESTSLS